jgi:hypothetical protein
MRVCYSADIIVIKIGFSLFEMLGENIINFS